MEEYVEGFFKAFEFFFEGVGIEFLTFYDFDERVFYAFEGLF